MDCIDKEQESKGMGKLLPYILTAIGAVLISSLVQKWTGPDVKDLEKNLRDLMVRDEDGQSAAKESPGEPGPVHEFPDEPIATIEPQMECPKSEPKIIKVPAYKTKYYDEGCHVDWDKGFVVAKVDINKGLNLRCLFNLKKRIIKSQWYQGYSRGGILRRH